MSQSSKPISRELTPNTLHSLLPLSEMPARLSKTPLIARVSWLLLLTMLGASLQGCGMLSKKPVETPCPSLVAVESPKLTTPIPSQSYSSVAADDISSWRKQLTGTPTTSKP